MKIFKTSIAVVLLLVVGLNNQTTFAQTQINTTEKVSAQSLQQSLDAYKKNNGNEAQIAYNTFYDKLNLVLAEKKANLPAVVNVNETPEYKEFEKLVHGFNALMVAKRDNNKTLIIQEMKRIISIVEK